MLNQTVQLVRGPLRALGPVDLVVITERPTVLPLEGGGTIPSTLYELHWPNGITTWHMRHEFEPIGS